MKKIVFLCILYILGLNGCASKSPEELAVESQKEAARIAARLELLTVKPSLNEVAFIVPNNRAHYFLSALKDEMRKKSKYEPYPIQTFENPHNIAPGWVHKGIVVADKEDKKAVIVAYRNSNFRPFENSDPAKSYYDMWAEFKYDVQANNINSVITIHMPKKMHERSHRDFFEFRWSTVPMDNEVNLMADLHTIMNHISKLNVTFHTALEEHWILDRKDLKLAMPTVITILSEQISNIRVNQFPDQTDVRGELMGIPVVAVLKPFKGGTRMSFEATLSKAITIAPNVEPLVDASALDELTEYVEYDLMEALK